MDQTSFFTSLEERWVWIDLEMTGLDENSCAIIQAAMVITDCQLNELSCCDMIIWQPPRVLEEMPPFVRDMHTKNGLLPQVQASKTSVSEAQQKLMTLLTQHVAYRKGILVGNSVYMDRRFLRRYMPSLESYLHYRQLDVSSIHTVCQSWYGDAGRPPKPPSTHNALDDIRACIDELRFYKKHCFRASVK
ncbi:MAG: oligoribonuclease [Myxococcota bacterium]